MTTPTKLNELNADAAASFLGDILIPYDAP